MFVNRELDGKNASNIRLFGSAGAAARYSPRVTVRSFTYWYLLAHSPFIGRTGYLVIGNENLRF